MNLIYENTITMCNKTYSLDNKSYYFVINNYLVHTFLYNIGTVFDMRSVPTGKRRFFVFDD